MSEKFNFEEALKALQSGQAITGKDGVLAPLIEQLTAVSYTHLTLPTIYSV